MKEIVVWEKNFAVGSVAQMQDFALLLSNVLQKGDLLVLQGELGAGKTTFTQGLAAALGVVSRVVSPTFVLMRFYETFLDKPNLVHVDAYRLSSGFEVDELGLEDFMDSSVTVVEWGVGLVEHLSSHRLLIVLDRGADVLLEDGFCDSVRKVQVLAYGRRWESVVF